MSAGWDTIWRSGRWPVALLDAGQREWRRRWYATQGSWVWWVARQRGKSYAAIVLAVEMALTRPGAIVRYVAKTKESAAGIVLPTLALVLETCPRDLLPRRGRNEYEWQWPNGSRLVVFGTDAQSFDRGRGPRTHLQLYDEAGFYQDLPRAEAALEPALQTTGGRALYLSTPPESPAHPYVQRRNAHAASGRLIVDTFWSNPRIKHEAIILGECERLGLAREELLASTYFRREYLAELTTEETRAAVPAWTWEKASYLTREVERPQHFDAYVGLDWGFGDPNAAIFAWHDVASNSLVVEDELELRGATLSQWSERLKEHEAGLYGANRFDGTLSAAVAWAELPPYLRGFAHADAPRQPFMRVGDDAPLILAEMAVEHGYAILPSRKDDKHVAVDDLNSFIANNRIVINPRCKRLIAQLHSTLWDKQRRKWVRTTQDHGDLLDCLVYVSRNVQWHRDCRPKPRAFDFSEPRVGWESLQ